MKRGRSLSAKTWTVPRRVQFFTRPSAAAPSSKPEQRIRSACRAFDMNCACTPQRLRAALSLSSGAMRR